MQPMQILRDEILIVQRGAADGCSRQRHRLKHTGRREHTGAAHIDFNVDETAFFFLRRIFERLGPAGELRRASERFPLGKVIHLNDGAINGISQRSPHFPDLPHTRNHLVHGTADAIQIRHGKAQLPQKTE